MIQIRIFCVSILIVTLDIKRGIKMKDLFGVELKKQIEGLIARDKESIANRARRITDGWTDMDDCFLSEKLEQTGLDMYRMQLKILETDGLDDFDGLEDESGHQVIPPHIKTKYGWAYMIKDENGKAYFANSVKALAKKSGLRLVNIRRPVWVKLSACGSGLCGAYNAFPKIQRWDTNMVTGEFYGLD